MERAETRVAPDMSAEELSATMLGYATSARRARLGRGVARARNRHRSRRAGYERARGEPRDVARAALGFAPEDETRDALEDAVRRTAPTMDPQNVANAGVRVRTRAAPGAAAL